MTEIWHIAGFLGILCAIRDLPAVDSLKVSFNIKMATLSTRMIAIGWCLSPFLLCQVQVQGMAGHHEWTSEVHQGWR